MWTLQCGLSSVRLLAISFIQSIFTVDQELDKAIYWNFWSLLTIRLAWSMDQKRTLLMSPWTGFCFQPVFLEPCHSSVQWWCSGSRYPWLDEYFGLESAWEPHSSTPLQFWYNPSALAALGLAEGQPIRRNNRKKKIKQKKIDNYNSNRLWPRSRYHIYISIFHWYPLYFEINKHAGAACLQPVCTQHGHGCTSHSMQNIIGVCC